MKSPVSLSLFFPAYNEEASIEAAVTQADTVLKKLVDTYEIIVVDDGSTDQTGAIASALAKQNKRVRVIQHAKNKGYGGAVVSGLQAATYDYIFFTDADLQFDLREIEHLLAHTPAFDIVLGYREHRRDPFFRLVNAYGWHLANRLVFGLRVRDIDCAFKLLKRDRVQDLTITSQGAMVSAELLIQLQQQGVPFKEVPVTHLPRTTGAPTGAKPAVILRAFTELVRFRRNRYSK